MQSFQVLRGMDRGSNLSLILDESVMEHLTKECTHMNDKLLTRLTQHDSTDDVVRGEPSSHPLHMGDTDKLCFVHGEMLQKDVGKYQSSPRCGIKFFIWSVNAVLGIVENDLVGYEKGLVYVRRTEQDTMEPNTPCDTAYYIS